MIIYRVLWIVSELLCRSFDSFEDTEVMVLWILSRKSMAIRRLGIQNRKFYISGKYTHKFLFAQIKFKFFKFLKQRGKRKEENKKKEKKKRKVFATSATRLRAFALLRKTGQQRR